MTTSGTTQTMENSMLPEYSTLTRLREFLGEVRKYKTFGETQDFLNKAEANYAKIGLKVLEQTLDEASYCLVHTNKHLSKYELAMVATSREAFLFILGTGLDIMVQAYSLDYDPTEIRKVFCRTFHVKA